VLLGFQSQVLDTRGGPLAFWHGRREALDSGGSGRRERGGSEGALVREGGERGDGEGSEDGNEGGEGGELRELRVEGGEGGEGGEGARERAESWRGLQQRAGQEDEAGVLELFQLLCK